MKLWLGGRGREGGGGGGGGGGDRHPANHPGASSARALSVTRSLNSTFFKVLYLKFLISRCASISSIYPVKWVINEHPL